LLFESGMRMREVARAVAAAALSLALMSGCTGGQESSAAEEQEPKKNPIAATQTTATAPSTQPQVDPNKELKSISPAIPVYAGARYRDDLTRRDSVMVKNQYGANAEVITLATDDSFPQVYHYYTTYLAQFRAYPPQPPFPPQQNWRTLEVQLNQAMQDPFIPGDTMKAQDKQVVLQVAETEAAPKTVIRYIITPAAAGGSQVAAK
jgi:hypothetical protein